MPSNRPEEFVLVCASHAIIWAIGASWVILESITYVFPIPPSVGHPFSSWVGLFPIGSSGERHSCFADADDGHHAAGAALRAAMREEEIGLALRAPGDNPNGSRREAAVEKLAAVGLNEIGVQAGAQGRVARRALR